MPPSGAGGEGGVASGPQAGSPGVGLAGETGVGVAGSGVNIGGTGSTGTDPCPVSADLAPAYYYVVLDGTGEMQSLPTIRQALSQFANQPASAGVLFGLQLIDPVCAADYGQPLIDFTPLPNVELPTLQPQAGKQMLLDSALGQTLDTLLAIEEPASKTLVVITGGVDQACGNSADLLHQTLSEALASGVSLRSVLVLGADAPTAQISSGLQVQGSPPPVQLSGQTLAASTVLQSLDQFRDVLAPCTYVAPAAPRYSVRLGASTLRLVASASACSDQPSYYEQGKTFVLCPSACRNQGDTEVQTDECSSGSAGAGGKSGNGGAGAPSSNGGNGGSPGTAGKSGIAGGTSAGGAPAAGGSMGSAGTGAGSCPAFKPENGGDCTTPLLTCTYGSVSCICSPTTWTCNAP